MWLHLRRRQASALVFFFFLQLCGNQSTGVRHLIKWPQKSGCLGCGNSFFQPDAMDSGCGYTLSHSPFFSPTPKLWISVNWKHQEAGFMLSLICFGNKSGHFLKILLPKHRTKGRTSVFLKNIALPPLIQISVWFGRQCRVTCSSVLNCT